MRLVAIAFWTSNVLLVAAGSAYAWRRLHASPQPQAAQADVRVTSFRPKEFAAVALEPQGRRAAGIIEFHVGAGERLVGIAAARAFPVEGGAPALASGTDFSAAQLGARIDTREWLGRTGIPPEALLNFDLIVCGAEGREEYRQGWARLDVISLRTNGVSIEAPARRSVTVCVRTAEGQPVPGALVVVDVTDVTTPGLASQFAVTGDDGTAVLSGLEEGTTYRASLEDGVGPDPRVVSACVTGGGPRQELRVALPGKWEFVRHRLFLGGPGATARATEVRAQDPSCGGVWAVSSWVPPGRGFNAPFWVMFPASDSPRALAARLSFSQREGVDVPDLRTPLRLALPPQTKDVVIVGGTSGDATAGTPR